MKIGILTFHRAVNCGAVLQAYALQRYISDMGYDCEIIDYRCDAIESAYNLIHTPVSLKSIISDLLYYNIRIRKKKKFDAFLHNKLVISPSSYYRSDIKKMEEKYDCFFVGSDQVWNRNLIDKDDTFFLDFCSCNKKYSYAASLGNNKLSDEQKEYYSRMLDDFCGVSVREKSSVYLLSEIVKNKVVQNIDPVFLLPKEIWNQMTGDQIEKKSYIFAYCLHESDVYYEAQKMSKELGIRIICVPSGLRCSIKADFRKSLGPIEFLNLIRFADYIISDSFHAISFSIIFNKRFLAVRKKQYPELNERIDSLLQLLNIDSNATYLGNEDYLRIENIINSDRSKSNEYLSDAIIHSMVRLS